MTERERKDALFNKTMARLAAMGIEGPGITVAHIIALAEEIEGYREQIKSGDSHMTQLMEERDRLREEVEQLRKLLDQKIRAEDIPIYHEAEYRVSELECAIVQHFLDQYGPKARP